MTANLSNCPQEREQSAAITMWGVLRDPRAPRSPWSISQWLAVELAAYLERKRPRRILEVGSGFSTAILTAYAAQYGAQIVTLEHDVRYSKSTAKGLQRLGLQGLVDLRMSPLQRQWFGGQGPFWWYERPLEGDFDFVFVDGPPKILGRRGVFFALADHLQPGWRMWLDDGIRRHERQCIRLWADSFPGCFTWSRLDMDGKGIFVLEDAKMAEQPASRSATPQPLGIGILGAGTMSWWRRAEQTIGAQLLRSSHVVVTTRDEEPGRSVRRFASRFVDEWVPSDGRSSRARLSAMLDALASHPGVSCVLYLDDGWWPSTLDDDWLSRALDILEERPTVNRVSLQHRGDLGVQEAADHRAAPVPDTPSLLRVDGRKLMLQARRVRRGRRLPLTRSGVEPRAAHPGTEQLSPGVFRRNLGRGSSNARQPAATPVAAALPHPSTLRTIAAAATTNLLMVLRGRSPRYRRG